MMRFSSIIYFFVLMGLAGCSRGSEAPAEPPPSEPSINVPLPARRAYVPSDDTTLFIIGQDLASVRDYTQSSCCPRPAGVTTYIGLYDLLSSERNYGGLGVDANGTATEALVDWGGGPSNLVIAAQEAAPGLLAVGLDMTNNQHPGALAKVKDGAYDQEIDHLANTLKELSNPVLLRIGYEFDGNWNQGYQVHADYIAAYRHIVRRVVAKGATNVAFVWQSAAALVDDIAEGRAENLEDWYPGDEYVDWVGLSWFLPPNTTANVAGQMVRSIDMVDEVLAFAKARDKPVIIAEATPQGFHISESYRASIANLTPDQPGLNAPQGQGREELSGAEIWEQWFEPFFEYIEQHRDQIRAVAYINALWDTQGLWDPPYESGFWGDSRVQAAPENDAVVLERWKEVLARPYWRHGGDNLYKIIGAQAE